MIKYDLIWSDLIIHDIPGWCNDFKWNAWNATNTPKKRNETTADKEKKHETENCKASNMEITRTQENAKQSKRQWNYKDFLVQKKQLP